MNKKFHNTFGIGLIATAFAAASFLPGMGFAESPPPLPAPACPIQPASGRIIVNFDGSRIYTAGLLSVGPISASVPAGGYTVRAVSWDGYQTRTSVSQPHEQWYATVEDASGELAATGVVSDVPDNVIQATVDEIVNDSANLLVVPSAGTKVFARHAFPGDVSSPNSVVPICVSFDPIPAPVPPACPIQPAANRTIVNFPVSPAEQLCSYILGSGCSPSNSPVSLNLPAGNYTVSLVSWDGYPNRTNVFQPNEQWYASVQNNSGELAASGVIGDLADNVASATLTEMVNTGSNVLTIAAAVTKVVAKHAFPGSPGSSPNSVFPICAGFDKITSPPPPSALSGSCSVSPASGAVNDSFTWSASASGGTGNYTFSWAGDEGLSGASPTVVKSYTAGGTKNGTVVITSGSESILRSCSVTVTTKTIETPFDGTCAVSPATASIGETVQWSSSASGGAGTYTYSWSGNEGLTGTTGTLAKAYGSAGTKLGTVTVTSGPQSVTKTCAVFITPPPGCVSNCGGGWNQPNVILLKKATSTTLASASVYMSQTPQTLAAASIYLSQLPYTGVVKDNAQAVGYIALLLAASGVLTYIISRKKSDKHLFKDIARLVDITDETKQIYSAHESGAPHSAYPTGEAARRDSATSDVAEFISLLASSDSQSVFNYLRSASRQGTDLPQFIIAAASELDLVYRNRIDAHATMPPENTRKAVEEWDNNRLEDVISILVGSVDESYRSNHTPIKLAVAKIMGRGTPHSGHESFSV